ncbi:MGT family glycosyltransferase [Pseudonocardia eucalypti]|nr:MGT family glycosyltransferase [Pseudonocardia eucalypti]
MERIVMAGMPAAGHLNPSLPLVRELVRRGTRVTYYTGEEFKDAVERTGAEFRGYPPGTIGSRDIAEATQSGSSFAVVARILRATDTLLPFLLDELRDRPPSALVHDSNALWGRMAGASLGLPRVSFMTTFMLGTKDLKVLTAREWARFIGPGLPDLPAVLSAKRRLVRRFGKALFPPAPTFPMRGDLTLFPIPRQLQPPNPLVDERCRFIGPSIEPRGDEPDGDLAGWLAGPEPVVLVSLGTLHAGSEAFFRDCFEALGDLPARVVMAVGRDTDPARLGRPPANTLVRASVPQLAVLRHAATFVTHGGMNSALEGLGLGVPLVVVPQQVEQLIIGNAVAERGAGTVLRQHLSGRRVPPAELRASVRRALDDPALPAAARAFGATFGEGGGPAAGVEAIYRMEVTRPA